MHVTSRNFGRGHWH